MKRFKNAVIVAAVASSLIVTPVSATPSVNEIKENKTKTEKKLKSANDELADLLVGFEVLKGDIANQKVKIKKADKDLKKAKKIEEKQYREMMIRIKYMYENGEDGDINSLLNAGSFGEMINQVEYIQSVHTYDRKMLKEYKKTKEKVADRKLELESQKADMDFMADTYEVEQKELNKTISKLKDQVDDFDEQYKKALKKAEEEARRLEEETRRAEEAANQAQANQAANEERPSAPDNSSKPDTPSKPASPSKPEKPSTPSGPSGGNSGGGNKENSSGGGAASRPSNTSKGQQIANTGLKYVGNKYVYGGNSLTNGIDCSGFTQQVHALCGIRGLARSSSAQRYGGKAVNGLANALPGDVICYDGHVAIYLGNNQIVHASSPAPYPQGGIKVTNRATYRTILAIRRYW